MASGGGCAMYRGSRATYAGGRTVGPLGGWSAARLPSGAGDVAGAERDHDRRGGGDGGAGEVGAGGGLGGPGGCSGSVGAGRF